MITQNYWKALGYIVTGCTEKYQDEGGGNVSNISNVYSLNYALSSSLRGNNAYLRFGDGDTPPTVDDLRLSGNTLSGLTFTVSTVKEARKLKAIIVLTNTNSAEVTIKEVGIFIDLNASYLKGLVERTVLDTPVTIPAGDIGKVEYTITFNLPTA